MAQKDFFQFLTPEQISYISDYAESIDLKAGEPLYFRNTKANFMFIVLAGEISLRLPGRQDDEGILIDVLPKGTVFGRCVSFAREAYMLNARCRQDGRVLKIAADVLKKVLDDNPRLGYAVQSKISEIYYDRYIQTMRKLHDLIMTR